MKTVTSQFEVLEYLAAGYRLLLSRDMATPTMAYNHNPHTVVRVAPLTATALRRGGLIELASTIAGVHRYYRLSSKAFLVLGSQPERHRVCAPRYVSLGEVVDVLRDAGLPVLEPFVWVTQPRQGGALSFSHVGGSTAIHYAAEGTAGYVHPADERNAAAYAPEQQQLLTRAAEALRQAGLFVEVMAYPEPYASRPGVEGVATASLLVPEYQPKEVQHGEA